MTGLPKVLYINLTPEKKKLSSALYSVHHQPKKFTYFVISGCGYLLFVLIRVAERTHSVNLSIIGTRHRLKLALRMVRPTRVHADESI